MIWCRKWQAHRENDAIDPERTSRKGDGDVHAQARFPALLALAVERKAAHDGKWAQTMMRPRVVTKRPITEVAATSIDSARASGRHSIQGHTQGVLRAAWPLAIFGGFSMLRISAFIAVLALIGAVTTGAWAAQGAYARSGYQAGCYNSQRCASFCNQHGGTNCKQVCQRRASTMPHC